MRFFRSVAWLLSYSRAPPPPDERALPAVTGSAAILSIVFLNQRRSKTEASTANADLQEKF